MRRLLLTMGVLWVAPLGVSRVAEATDVVVADRYQAPDGSLKPDAAIVIASGKISSVSGIADLPKRNGIDHYPGGVVCPGMIDLSSQLGAYGHRSESAYSIDPSASAIDVVDAGHRDFRAALSAGVTTVMISPANTNLVSGASVIVKTTGEVVEAEGPLALALGPAVWSFDRAPTSRVGSVAALRGAMSAAREGRGHDRLKAFSLGELSGICMCGESMDVDAALRTFVGCRLAIAYTGSQLDVVDRLSSASVPLVVGPLDTNMAPRVLMLAGRAEKAGVTVALSGGLPMFSGDSIRVSAALAARHGMTVEGARAAMSTTAAQIAGVGNRLGALRAGMDADFVVFSGDPLRLDSRVLAVYVAGKRVYAEPPALTGGSR